MLDVELYGVLQQLAGARSVRVEVREEAPTVEQVLERLRGEVPALADHLPRVACAQGEHLVRRGDRVDPARPLVLLPPVSGGSHSLPVEAH